MARSPAPPPRRVAPAPDPSAELAARLAPRLHTGLASLVLTENRRRIVSARPDRDGRLKIRIHHTFTNASETVLDAVSIFFRPGVRREMRNAALRIIRDHFAAHTSSAVTDGEPAEQAPRRRRPPTLSPHGRYHDLNAIRDAVNREYFDGKLDLQITWGQEPARRRRRRGQGVSIRLGCFVSDDNLVRIHPVLDRADVPAYVVESVVHHEMLHAVVPPVVRPGRRRVVHPPEFRRRERLFRHHERAERWIDENLLRLAKARHRRS